MAHRPNRPPGSSVWSVLPLSGAVIGVSASSILLTPSTRPWWTVRPSLEQAVVVLAACIGLSVTCAIALRTLARRNALRRGTLILGIGCLLATMPVAPAASTVPGFDLPPEDVSGSSSNPQRATTQSSTHIVDRGDSLWSISAERVTRVGGRTPAARDVGPYWRSVVTMNLPRLSSGDADLIYPGEQVVLPAVEDIP